MLLKFGLLCCSLRINKNRVAVFFVCWNAREPHGCQRQPPKTKIWGASSFAETNTQWTEDDDVSTMVREDGEIIVEAGDSCDGMAGVHLHGESADVKNASSRTPED